MQAADGDLDPTFGTNGIVSTDFNASQDFGSSVVIQPDGRIVVAGETAINGKLNVALARYLPDGSLDTTFDGDGKVTSDFGDQSDNGVAVALQADGKILLAGSARNQTSNQNEYVLARYNSNGSLDITFDLDGKVTVPFLGFINAVAVQPDGKIVLVGDNYTSGDFVLVRYNRDGSLDTGFGINGFVVTDFGNSASGCAVAIQASDGKIIAAGPSYASGNSYLALARYHSDGSLDATFDFDGKVITSVGTNDRICDLALQEDGKILAAGAGDQVGTGRDFVLVRYNSDGSLDTTFDSDGKVTTDFGSNENGNAVAVQPDGRILLAGTVNNDAKTGLARYRSDGSLDPSFGVDGKVVTDVGFVFSGQDMVLQPDHNIIVAGMSVTGTDSYDFAVARYIYHSGSRIHYVKSDAQGANNGISWADAFTDLQSALATAFSGDEIWVAAGTYRPTTGSDRSVSFTLKNDVALYGGFAGSETSLAQRDTLANPTVLSGDIGNLDDDRDNSYHVVVGSGTNNSAILDGFTVTEGHTKELADFSPESRGGGMYSYYGSPNVRNVAFINNYGEFGGGMYNGGDFNPGLEPEIAAYPILTDVIFKNNSSFEGGGLFNENHIQATLSNVIFEGNTAVRGGGGMEDRQGFPSLTNVVFKNNWGGLASGGMQNFSIKASFTNVTFSGNSSSMYGGGLVNSSTDPILMNVTFYGNSAEQGGGIWNNNSKPVLTNVTFYNNSASAFGGAIYSDSDYGNGSQTTLRNAILWGNTAPTGAQIYNSDTSAAIVSNSVVQDGFADGTNIITADPLLGTLGNYGGFTETILLRSGSPAIDVGNDEDCPASDQRGIKRPQGSHCDLGAYEFQPPTFSDVPMDHWAWSYIERLYAAGITGGCTSTPLNYCPGSTVTRAQMAIFLLRAEHGSTYRPPAAIGMFSDVPETDLAAPWIEQLVNEGITGGCGGGKYCPTNPVTRAQMAIFLLRAEHGTPYFPPTAAGMFLDVPVTDFAAPFIEQLANEKVTGGCSATKYCPGSAVTRDQMAIFLVRAFKLP
ncbi:MAG: choice-of-anchor Q domain-containing protein [Syntrophothermus sp.]